MLHYKVYDIAALAASKAFAQTLGRGDVKRGSLVVVERAQPYEVHTPLLQVHELGNHLFDVCGIEYSFNGLLVYHGSWFLRSAKIMKSINHTKD
jgi:hypothetical protein